MANEQSGAPLRRWRSFYGAFAAIDDAIEAAGHPRAAFVDARVRIVKLLRAATDDGVAEQLCAALDEAMAAALETLRAAPVPHGALASTDLARAVGGLRNHGSPRIRGLAGDVVRGWSAANVAAATAVKEELHKLGRRQDISTAVKKQIVAQSDKIGTKKPIAAAQGEKKMEAKKKPTTVAQIEKTQGEKKMEAKKPTTIAQIEKTTEAKKPMVTQSEKMEATKRKLREGYQEAEKIKRQHVIKKIEDKEAPELLEQSERKMTMHRGGPARCRTISSGVRRRSLLPSLQLV